VRSLLASGDGGAVGSAGVHVEQHERQVRRSVGNAGGIDLIHRQRGRLLGPETELDGKTCSVTVAYTPSAADAESAALTATSKKPAASASITLIGTGARRVYWTNFNSVNSGTVGRANADGSDVNQGFIIGGSNTIGVAVDSDHIYWTNAADGTIGRASLDGSEVNNSFISGASIPIAAAVDSNHIYWTNTNSLDSGTIGRANLDGSDVNQSFIVAADNPRGWPSTPTTSTGPTSPPAPSSGRTWTGPT